MDHAGISEFALVGRLALAGLLGGLIGLERETHGQPAGLRTHMVVAIGSCLIMLVSVYMHDVVETHADPGRIAAQVVAGIGFLGAGAIMRFGMSVKGLTTAACLWTSAAIGLAVGCGYWKAGAAATGLTLVSILVFDKVERAFITGRGLRRLVVHAKDVPGLVGRVESLMEKAGISIQELDIERNLVERKLQITIMANVTDRTDVDVLSRDISAIGDVEKVEIV